MIKIDEIESARELFKVLEEKGPGSAAEIARRAFLIQERLAVAENRRRD